MKNYIYIGENYHISGKKLPQDCNIGITNNLTQTEDFFNNTKMATKFRIVKSWEVLDNMKLENLEKIISDRFSINKYDVTNWYDIDTKEVYTEMTKLFNDLRIATNGEYSLIEIDKEVPYREESKKRAEYSNLDITIGGVKIGGRTAKDKYTNAISYMVENNMITPDKINQNFGCILKKDKSELIGNHKCSSFIYGYHLECYNGTYVKKKNLDRINKKFKLGIVCKVIDPN